MSKTRRKRFEAKLKKSKEDLKEQVEVLSTKNRKQREQIEVRDEALHILVPTLDDEQKGEIKDLDDEKHEKVKDLLRKFMR